MYRIFPSRVDRLLVTYLAGQFISMFGDELELVALSYWIGIEHKAPALLAALFISGTIPQILLFLLGGWLADRWNPFRVLLLSDAMYLLGSCFVAFVALSGQLNLAWLIPPFVIMGAMGGLYYPARAAIIKVLAGENLARANQAMVLAERLGTIGGPLLSGLLLVVIGVAGVYLVNAATYLVAIITTLWVYRVKLGTVSSTEKAADRLPLLQVFRDHPVIRFLLSLSFFAAGAFNAAMAIGLPMLVLALDASPTSLGLIISVFGGGAILGASLSRTLRIRPVHIVVGCYTLIGIMLLGLPWTHSTLIAAPLLFLIGITSGIQTVWYRTTLQQATPSGAITRVMALSFVAGIGGGALLQMAAGFLGSVAQAVGIFTLTGGIMVVAGLLGIFSLMRGFMSERIEEGAGQV